MSATRTVWVIRVAGLVLFLASVVVFINTYNFGNWLGDTTWAYPNNAARYANVVAAAVFLRLLVFGFRIWARIGIIILIFFGLYVLVLYSPELIGDTSPYARDGAAFLQELYVFPAAAISLILAAIPMFDRKGGEGAT